MKKAEVKFENITKKFNETTAVDNVSCNFEAGTLTTLLGPSGCGKTTSLRIIAGLERATSGKILVDNEDVTLLPATDRDVSMVFQSYALFPHMSVIENVSYGLKMINVNNHAPVTNVLFDATPKNTPAIIHLSADDSDGDVLTYSMVSQPQNGSMNVSGTTFIYTPTQEFTGIDFFTFKATDGALESNVATVTINVYNKAILSEAGLIHQSLTGSVTSDGFGTAIATNGNGSLFIVSSPGFDQTGSVNSGKASVFINSGSQWELMDSEIFGQNAGDYFGSSVEMFITLPHTL